MSKNKGINRLNLGVIDRFVSSSSINNSDEILGCESSPLSLVCLIKDGAIRFCHVAHEEVSLNACHLIFTECLRCSLVSIGVHRACLISTLIIS